MNIKVHKDFFDKEKFTDLQSFILSDKFSFCYSEATTVFPEDPHWEQCKLLETPQMCRTLFQRTNITQKYDFKTPQDFHQSIFTHKYFSEIPYLHELIEVMLEKVSMISNKIDIHRMKINLLMPYLNAPEHHPPHTDMLSNTHKSFLYYLNDVDGDTFFFDKLNSNNIVHRLTPKANTMIEFDSNISHASSNPTQGPRYVLNTILELF